MRKWRYFSAALLSVGLSIMASAMGCASSADPDASEAANTIRTEMARIAEETKAAETRPDVPNPCVGVSDEDVRQVETQMRRLDRDLVVLGADEMRALDCARSRRDS